MLQARVYEALSAALAKASWASELPLDAVKALPLERPRNRDFGHYALNVSSWAKPLKLAPPVIAQQVVEALASHPDIQAQAVQGFVNLTLSEGWLLSALSHSVATPSVGKNQALCDVAMLLEYVSANPTGPLHVGHGRWAALGDSLVRILRHCGATVTPEFYINDAGEQMRKIGVSVLFRSREALIAAGKLPDVPLAMEYPYPGDYVLEAANAFVGQLGVLDESTLLAIWNRLAGLETPLHYDYLALLPEEEAWLNTVLIAWVKNYMLADQQALLHRLGVTFEAWFSEKELLHDRGLVTHMLDHLKGTRFAYESEEALWLQSSELGDDKDRVLVKSDGSFTYLAADIAYHHQKFTREDDSGQPQYNRITNIWGADHHGYIPRMRAALIALGHLRDEHDSAFEIILGQLVNLIVEGERERMGKRRKMLTLSEVVDAVGVDATRFWMVSKSADTTLDFDLALAASASHENPVFYVQYAHARCASIIGNALHPTQTQPDPLAPFVTPQALDRLKAEPTVAQLAPLLDPESGLEPTTLQAIQQLLVELDRFESVVIAAAKTRAPHLIARYAQDIAGEFHGVYTVCRMLTDRPDLTLARLGLVLGVKQTLAQALYLLGVSAPESM
ncbi:MAG: arginine--tRNA ligase [Vampirovibrionales bacterium]